MIKYILIACLLLLSETPARAGTSEAREVARINNCDPKKIEVFKNELGRAGQTIYQVTCNIPKTTDKESASGADALLISCDQSLCEMMRPITLDKK